MFLLTLKIQINSKLSELSNHGFESADGEKGVNSILKIKFSPLNKKMSKAKNINQVSAGINFYSHSSKVRNDPDYTQFIIQTIKGTMLY